MLNIIKMQKVIVFFKCLYDDYKKYKLFRYYSKQYKSYILLHGFENKRAEGEEEYLKKWSVLSSRVEPYSYRFFIHYVGRTPNIIPEDIGRTIIEKILNPIEYRKTYSDKNLFPEIIGKEFVPKTLICRINNSNLLDKNFVFADKPINFYLRDYDNVILKPSLNSSSGRGIIKFIKDGENYVSHDKTILLSDAFLRSFDSDFCLQEAINQHAFMKRLCATSVNTVRLCLYRSISDEKTVVTSAIIRIGKSGSFVDNVHAGGMFTGVNIKTGELGKFVIDQYGNRKRTWNNIDYSTTILIIPFWERILSFAQYIGSRLHHLRLIAVDIALNESGEPILLEYNITSFSYWLFMLTGQDVFGDYLDEIINFCKRQAVK